MPRHHPLLVVEDDPEVRSSLCFWLTAEGHAVECFERASDVLDCELPAGSVMIVDERLPDESGIALIRKLRLRGAAMPSILITTNPSDALRIACRAETVRIVEKPLISDDLLDAIACAARRAV